MSSVCRKCGFAQNTSGATVCRCGESLEGGAEGNEERPAEGNDRPRDDSSTEEETRPEVPLPVLPAGKASLSGTVSWLDQSSESVPFNPYRFLSKVILFLLLLPVVAGVFAFLTAVAIAFAILGFKEMARGTNPFNPANSINAVGVFFGFFRGGGKEQEPVLRLSLHDGSAEHAAVIRGKFHGLVRQGDHVSLVGKGRDGTLVVRKGTNHTHGNAGIVLPVDPWKIAFFPLFAVLAGLITYAARLMR